jgi:diguanylate cyclase (GGDEF)-like protein
MQAEQVRVLVAEDSEVQRAGIADLLRDQGLRVDEAADGRMALDLCRIVHPDLVLLDIGLPALDGWGVLDRIRADHRVGTTPVLVITVDSTEQTAARALESGATDFIAKPIRPMELLARVRRVLRENAAKQDLMERNRALTRAAAVDELTGLPNRRSITAALALATGSRAAVGAILIDVDHFKAINDDYGHAAGDPVLGAVAARLRDHAQEGQLVGRLGGDEFIAVIPDGGAERALSTASALQRAAGAEPIRFGRHTIDVTVSVGWACDAAQGTEALLELADRALYTAKAEGRNCVRPAQE